MIAEVAYECFGHDMDPALFARASKFDEENPMVWDLFVRFSLQAKSNGRDYMGAKAVIERIRWYTSVETTGPLFKLNNSHTAYYARKFLHKHPHLAGFFKLRATPKEL